MDLIVHESVHFTISLVIGFFLWKKCKKFWSSFIGAILGGFLVDLDHLIDYFLAFGFKFDLIYFIKGYQFLKMDKIYVFFHSFELVGVILLFSLFVDKRKLALKSFLIALAVGLFSHLLIDSTSNGMRWQAYVITYRIANNFDLKSQVTPNHYLYHLVLKNKIKL